MKLLAATLLLATAAAAQPADPWLTLPQGAEACFGSTTPCAIAPGVSYRQQRRTGGTPLVVHIAEIDLTRPGLSVRPTAADRTAGMEYRAQTASRFLAQSGAVLAVNASYFLPFIGGSPGGSDFVPQPGQAADASGAVIVGGQTVSPPDSVDARVDAIACFAPGKAQIVPGQACPTGFTDGVSAGPRLLAAGQAIPRRALGRDNAFHGATELPPGTPPPEASTGGGPRTALGLNGAGTKLWLIVADGRQPDWSMGMNHEDLIALFQSLGATEAMSLDGGGSATMVARTPAGPMVLSRPIHTGVPGRERPLGNHLGVYLADMPAAPRGAAGLLPPLPTRSIPRLAAKLERIYGAPEARQGVAADATHFYALVNTAIGKYARSTGKLITRWAAPRGGLIRHLNSCTVLAADLVCAHSNHPEVPHGSSIETWNTADLSHKSSTSLGNRDEGSLTIVEPMKDGWLLGFAHYSDETGVPFKGHDHSQIITTDLNFTRREGFLIPPPIRARMAPQAASGGAIGPDGLLYLFGHTLPELYILARPAMGAELIHLATIDLDAGGQAFTFDPTDPSRIFAIDRPSGTVRVFKLPDAPALPADARRFERRASRR